ncbi:SET domain-containing protein-lysine N-methyltransferase [Winogradskyella wichelsiae]|uniref:SET domain-containing protein-lysine N-methyltransferase n=1 Tax=Winogradskyella wichelsiae TaxID=2697007 RepID=UPI001FEA36BE|nr:SET domain-containing protein-lysine N-methyltransferase [Winogradskyella wichelsiae]
MNNTDIEDSYVNTNAIEAPESDYLYIQPSQIKNAGNGLFTAMEIYEDEIISLFKGEIINNDEAKLRAEQNNDKYFINLLDDTIMDSMHTDCYAKYANDAEGLSTSSKFKNNTTITLDEDHNVCIKASRNIEPGEELFCGYGESYWEKHS